MSDGKLKVKAEVDGLEEAGRKIDDFSKRSTIALTSLNQVIQDLPFGFIGIQNNLPILVQQFGSLVKETGSVKNAFLELGGAISGTVGIVFGVSVLTSAITGLVQKYGTLGKAIDVIVGNTITATDVQNQLTDAINSTSGASKVEVIELQNLSNALINTNAGSKQRKDYIELTNKEYPGLLANIDAETLSSEKLRDVLTERIGLQISQINLNAQQKILEERLTKAYNEQYKTLKDVEKLNPFEILSNQLKGLIQNFKEGKLQNDAFSFLLKGLNQTLGNSSTEVSEYEKALDKNQIALNKVNAEILANIKAGRDKAKSDKDAIKNSIELAKLEEKRARLLEQIRRSELESIKTTNIKVGKDNINNLIRYGQLQVKNKPIEFFDIVSVQDSFDKFLNKIKANPPKPTIDVTPLAAPEINAALQKRLDLFNENYKIAKELGLTVVEYDEIQRKSFLETGQVIYNSILTPLNQLFDVILTKGKKSWEDFTASVVQSLKKLLVKLAAAAALAAILSAISGGASNVSGGGVGFFEAFGSLLGLKGGGVAKPSFGGVQPGGMQMAGSVNMVLRGQDLVGSLNRTNSQFSRIG